MSVSWLVGWSVGLSLCPSIHVDFFSPFYVVSIHFKSFYILTFCLLVLTTVRDLEVLALLMLFLLLILLELAPPAYCLFNILTNGHLRGDAN